MVRVPIESSLVAYLLIDAPGPRCSAIFRLTIIRATMQLPTDDDA